MNSNQDNNLQGTPSEEEFFDEQTFDSVSTYYTSDEPKFEFHSELNRYIYPGYEKTISKVIDYLLLIPKNSWFNEQDLDLES